MGNSTSSSLVRTAPLPVLKRLDVRVIREIKRGTRTANIVKLLEEAERPLLVGEIYGRLGRNQPNRRLHMYGYINKLLYREIIVRSGSRGSYTFTLNPEVKLCWVDSYTPWNVN